MLRTIGLWWLFRSWLTYEFIAGVVRFPIARFNVLMVKILRNGWFGSCVKNFWVDFQWLRHMFCVFFKELKRDVCWIAH